MKFKSLEIEEQKNLFAIIIVAFIIRLLFIIEILRTPFVEYLFSDSMIYINFADIFLTSNFWSGSEPFYIAPLYPVLISIFRFVFSDNNFIIYLSQAILSSAAIFFIYLTAKNIGNKNMALVSAIIAALFDSYIFYSGLIFSETYEIFLVAVLAFLLSDNVNLSKGKIWFGIGLLLGTLTLLSASYLFFILIFMIYGFFSKKISTIAGSVKRKMILLLVSGVLIIILPFTLINLIVSDQFVLFNTGIGINFNLANNSDANGISPSSNFDLEKDPSGKISASNYLVKKISASDASSYWYGKTIDNIIDNPGKFLVLLAQKTFLFFDTNHFPTSSIVDINFYEDNFSNILKLPFISYGLVSILFLLGFVLYLKEKKKSNIILLMLVSIFISIIFSYVNVRTKLGITPLLIVFSSYGIVKTFEVIKTGNLRILSVPIIVILLFILTNSFIIKKPEFSNYDAYYHFGEIAENEERYEEAIYNYNRSLMLNDRYETLLSLGNTFAKKQDFTNSLSAYNEAEKRNADDYYLHFNKGIVFANNGNYEKALESYTKSLNLNPDYPLTYRNIGILFYVSENYTEALKYFNKFLSLSDDQETNALVKKDIENIKMKLKN